MRVMRAASTTEATIGDEQDAEVVDRGEGIWELEDVDERDSAEAGDGDKPRHDVVERVGDLQICIGH